MYFNGGGGIKTRTSHFIILGYNLDLVRWLCKYLIHSPAVLAPVHHVSIYKP
uniref:Uncharacterized protein n=1 Tax=Anguilla anguilla TaxID=7936 RepID=A0A0E9WBX2_ANGAN